MSINKKILVLEPYYGGSHKSFLAGLVGNLDLDFDFLTLPARKWKWRMRLSGPYFAGELAEMSAETAATYDAILCSTFVDVASLKGLAPAWVNKIPILTYFHENQFAYPVQVEMERDFHYALTNFTTALASDRLAFNSQYNLATFLDGCKDLLKKSYDMKIADFAAQINHKSKVIHPAVDFSGIDATEVTVPNKVPVIVWNHRWEHDKNPQEFFAALFALQKTHDFNVVVLGESFRHQPPIFKEAADILVGRILQYGYAENRQEYINWLRRGDIVVSTAGHEFYGISIIEAVRAGCRPLLPQRLSYPELVPEEFIYGENELISRLAEALKMGRLAEKEAIALTAKFSWQALAEEYKEWLGGGV